MNDIGASNKQKTSYLLFKNDYFRVFVKSITNSPDVSVIISRRDTLETYGYYGSKIKSKQEMIFQAKEYIEQQKIDKPEDWKAPHRYCIAYCTRMEGERENMSFDSMRYQLDRKRWWSYINIRLLKETILLKKLNLLSFEERKQLLVVKDWELRNENDFRVHMGIFYRDYLYKRFFNKQGLGEHYIQYRLWLKKYLSKE